MTNNVTFRAIGKRAEILLYDDIGEDFFGGISAKDFAEEVQSLGDVSQIDVRINSLGGQVFDGLAIYNTLVRHAARVTTFVDGSALSIAGVIAMAGDEIKMAESASFMIHDASGIMMGNARDMRDLAGLLDKLSAQIGGILSARSGIAVAEIADLMTAETWYTGAEAMSAGFATEVTRNKAIAAHGDRSRFKNVPGFAKIDPL